MFLFYSLLTANLLFRPQEIVLLSAVHQSKEVTLCKEMLAVIDVSYWLSGTTILIDNLS